jgi:hypothetical protein
VITLDQNAAEPCRLTAAVENPCIANQCPHVASPKALFSARGVSHFAISLKYDFLVSS